MRILPHQPEPPNTGLPNEFTLTEGLTNIPETYIFTSTSHTFELTSTSYSGTTYIQLSSALATENLRVENFEIILENFEKLLQHKNIFIDEALKQLIISGEIPFEYFDISRKIASTIKTFLDYIFMNHPEANFGYMELKVFKEAEAEVSEPYICIKVYVPLKDFKEVSRIWDMTVDYLLEEFTSEDLEKIELFFTRL